ncbi:hypothetical protein LEP1GSC133_0408 [Leptospira borgpetersenii serovar Pomona str. 200901868]|uniref:Uncharacterized protein n=1 Tax=Leptospira borgpetersenii serovar Pomona str. 200901868 TaxID=1192866 RepID=M6W399_LEPBO|nr:hypothetical protein LEP1GSC133_0408 [Leptospira borgpetersenii serovar Pomona str. 200901868]
MRFFLKSKVYRDPNYPSEFSSFSPKYCVIQGREKEHVL